jgi:acyl-CoA synthetase (AMP-forming)/AMP-acid ligase II
MSMGAQDALVHAPLARWSRERAGQIAIDDGRERLSFAQLQQAVKRLLPRLEGAAATVTVDCQQSTAAQLVEFLAIIASGRCAAISDPDWTAPVRAAVSEMLAALPEPAAGPSEASAPFYIGFTSGSTGLPKGFRRDHGSWVESLRVCVDSFGPETAGTVLAPGRISHSLFLFGMLLGLWTGGGVVLQERFSAGRALETLRSGDATCLVAVPSQLLLMLDWSARRGLAPITATRLILISGARWMRERTPDLQALFPQARLVEFYGASETSFIAWQEADAATPYEIAGRPFANVEIEIRGPRDSQGNGMIYVRSPMLFIDYVGNQADATAALRDGDWLSVRDMGRIDEQGRLCLAGRQNRMIVTQGKNLFPDEVESLLATCPGIAGVSVQGLPDPIRGQQVVAVVQLAASDANRPPLTAQDLAAWCRERLESYKVPRRFLVCSDWPLTSSGKTDHHRIRQWLERLQDQPDSGAVPCLHRLH